MGGRRGRAGGWHPDDALVVATGEDEDQVLASAREEPGAQGLALAGKRCVVHPLGEPGGVELRVTHWLPPPSGRYAAKRARAAARLRGSHSDGHTSSVAL